MKQIIELRDTEKRKMIAETFGISLAILVKYSVSNGTEKMQKQSAKWHKKMAVLNIPKAMNHQK